MYMHVELRRGHPSWARYTFRCWPRSPCSVKPPPVGSSLPETPDFSLMPVTFRRMPCVSVFRRWQHSLAMQRLVGHRSGRSARRRRNAPLPIQFAVPVPALAQAAFLGPGLPLAQKLARRDGGCGVSPSIRASTANATAAAPPKPAPGRANVCGRSRFLVLFIRRVPVRAPLVLPGWCTATR